MTADCGTIRVEVLFFARAKELAGTGKGSLSLPAPATVADALRCIEEKYPEVGGPLRSCRVAVDEEFAEEEQPLEDGSVLAIIPPVSGG